MTYYLTDGSEDGFYTAVFDAYKDRDCIITSERNIQLGLDTRTVEVVCDAEKAERVKKKLRTLDRGAEKDVRLVLKSDSALKENTAFEYVKLIIKHNGAVRSMLADPTVIEMTDIRRRVTHETERFTGFLRFMENSEGVLYAPYSPDNDITDLLAQHFAARFASKKFVIHDIKRAIAALYDGNEILMTSAEGAEISLSEYEQYFEGLWKQYYKSVNIESRPHPKQMRGSMPVRYWKFLPEKR